MNRRSFAQLLGFSALALTTGVKAAPARVIKPKRLEEGDTVGMVLPASNTMQADSIAFAREQLEALGFRVKIGKHVYDRHGYFAGTDRDRADDVNRMFADPEVDGIFCYTGGWGTPRILPLLDYALIARHPKVLIGFSDITALLNAVYQRTGLITFHGPVASSMFTPYSIENFRNVVMDDEAPGVLEPPEKRPSELVDRTNRILHLSPGKAKGRIVGGNLTLIAALMGTPFEIETAGNILVLEDVDEDIYRIDRMLTQLALAGKLHRAAGVVFGRCTDCGDRNSGFSLEDILRDRFGSMSVPAIAGLSFGHIENKLTLPIGGMAVLDADGGWVELVEGAVF